MVRSRELSNPARQVLSVLLQRRNEWFYGYPLSRSTGVKSGTLYPMLARLAEQGYLEEKWEPSTKSGRPPRHAYRLTQTGVRLAQENPLIATPSIKPEGREAFG